MASKTPLGAFLAGLRKRTKTTQVRVADALGVTRLTVLGWENGSIRIYADHLGRFLEAVSATPEERAHATRLAADPDGIPAEPPTDDEFHLDLDADLDDDIPHTTHGFPESFDGPVLTDLIAPSPAPDVDTAQRLAPVAAGGAASPAVHGVLSPKDATGVCFDASVNARHVVGVCSRSSCGGDVVPLMDDELPRQWNRTVCLECGLERLQPRLRSVDEIPAAVEAEALRRGGRAA